jgi:3-(3-hydroxy-phenyl)propionate hydroxylase
MNPHVPNFEHREHPVRIPALRGDCDETGAKVLIAGGGPVGLAMALALAKYQIPSLVIEMDRTVCVGSRAICLSRRSLEILDRLGALGAFAEKGLPWTSGRSFHRNELVLQFSMMHDGDQRLAPMTNLQQYYIEAFLLDEVMRHPDLIEMRWGTRVEAVRPGPAGVEVELVAGDVRYRTQPEFVIACDGARSAVRQALNLRMNGTAYEGRYVIVDIELDIDLPTERLAWFDPPSNPGRTMLMHKQPDQLWRLDYQLHAHENAEDMIRPERVTPVVEAHLRMMGIERPWRLIWISTYKASALSLDSYRHGRVLFAGDAAHLVPIFGVRGLNSGFEDVFNLGWKLAAVVQGRAESALLDSYSEERRQAWEFNVHSAMKSTAFMAPPSRGYEVMRDAVLSLAAKHPALAHLINPRQSSAVHYEATSLNSAAAGEAGFRAGPSPGTALPECPVRVNGGRRFITELLPEGFALLAYLEAGQLSPDAIDELRSASQAGWPVSLRSVSPPSIEAELRSEINHQHIVDAEDRFRELFDAAPAAFYLVRPDGHVCARWRALRRGDLRAALQTATAVRQPEIVP